ncbi:hypothetical protein CI102_2459 [Trichoderma harzianum]|uniref:Uncharacterized protein n=1 Tax=Trichoderma harzianum CBS 226.95 TaxID=983964 RepID=A0A2T4A9F2_TRIHA|nr:hypothetical protein M431DRAFT_554863 [Trichoderma harzianum CBS 226.95]PKK52281.1 hypothetical protein CI102_2459 [Trichoderma harzianum]PTB53676.1 hypothetical protein M431DRAFT_554863 [Trichoderma harzianum CBS 226.95]
MTVVGSSASILEQEDLGLLSHGQTRANAKRISVLAALPEYENARVESGVAGLYREDQVQPRDAGISLAGKDVVSREVIRSQRLAVVKARSRIKSDIKLLLGQMLSRRTAIMRPFNA